jgi:hypothetical protein
MKVWLKVGRVRKALWEWSLWALGWGAWCVECGFEVSELRRKGMRLESAVRRAVRRDLRLGRQAAVILMVISTLLGWWCRL